MSSTQDESGAVVDADEVVGQARYLRLPTVPIMATVMIGRHPVFNGGDAASAGVMLLAQISLAGVGSCGAIGQLGGVLSTGAGSVVFALGLAGGNFFLGLALVMVPTLLATLIFRYHVQKLVDS